MIAAIFAVILIRLLVAREQRRNKNRGTSTEVLAVDYTEGGGSDDRDSTKGTKVGNVNALV